MKYFVVHYFWSKIMLFFVPAIIALWILFLNHTNRKVVGGKHNVLVHNVDVCAPDPTDVVLWNPVIWDILWFILIQNLVIFVCATAVKQIWFLNHRNRKDVGGKHKILVQYVNVCAPDPSGNVLWNFHMRYFVVHFWLKILLLVCLPH